MLARTIRAMMAASGSASVSAGRKRSEKSLLFEMLGNQRNRTEKTMISSNPNQKVGVDMPLTEIAINVVSSQEPWRSAAVSPSAKPSASAIASADSASATVLGNCSAIARETGT